MTVPISDYVSLSMTVAAGGLQVPSLKTPLLVAYHANYVERVREYTSLPGLAADGFGAGHPAYRMAQALLAQSPCPSSFKVGRRANAPVHAVELTCLTDTVGETITVTIHAPNGSSRSYSRSCAGGGIPAEATALAGLINADVSGYGAAGTTELLVAAVGNDVQIDPGAGAATGQIFYYSGLRNLDIEDVTPDPAGGLAADMTAISAADDDWYAAALDSPSAAEQTVLATATAVAGKSCWLSSQDSTIRNATAGNLALVLQAATRDRAAVFYSPHGMHEYPGICEMSKLITFNPGATTGAYQSLAGVTAAGTNAWDLSAAQLTNCRNARANVYVRAGGIGMVDGRQGVMSASRWMDERLLLDYLSINIPVELASALVARASAGSKVPYTDEAAAVARGAILKILQPAAAWGAVQLVDPVTGEETFTFSFLPAASQTSANKAARHFDQVVFNVLGTSAAQRYTIAGTVDL